MPHRTQCSVCFCGTVELKMRAVVNKCVHLYRRRCDCELDLSLYAVKCWDPARDNFRCTSQKRAATEQVGYPLQKARRDILILPERC